MTATEIAEAIQTSIAATGHASFKKASAVPTAAEAQDNVLYLVMNADTGFYDIYAKVENAVVRLDDVSVNLDGYSTTEQMNEAIATAIANKVDKVDGKGLSTEDFTTTPSSFAFASSVKSLVLSPLPATLSTLPARASGRPVTLA